jgi:hypothetical protein
MLVVTAIWKPRLPPPAATTATETNNNKSSQTQNHNWSGRQADSLQAGYLPTCLLQLPTINTYLPAQRLLPTNSFCSFTTTTTPVAWNFLEQQKQQKKPQQQQNS